MVDEVGRDAVRFMMLYRKNDAVLDFDLAKVIEQSQRQSGLLRPVRPRPRPFGVPQRRARRCRICRRTPAARAALLAQAPLERLDDPAELALMRKIALYPRLVEAAALAHEPHRIAFYLYELASEFHAQWTRGNGFASFTLHYPR